MLARSCARQLARRAYSTSARELVKIVEVGPRDGLQNEASRVPAAVRAELVDRLARTGLTAVEAGSFVSPKWVPQMDHTADVLRAVNAHPGTSYPVLVPNAYGLDAFLRLLSEDPRAPTGSDAPPAPIPSPEDFKSAYPHLDEIAVFVAATDAFSQANTNAPVSVMLEKLAPVVERARKYGLRARGYVSVVVGCPYSGDVDPARVREVTRALVDMGCYEVSLGDTVGVGTPDKVRAMLDEVVRGPGGVDVSLLAGHFHDTYGMGVANVLAALDAGVRTIDSSVAGLGGCPYSPGATGNVATEDVLYALRGSSKYATVGGAEKDIDAVARVGEWICGLLGRQGESRVARALKSKREKGKEAKAKL